MTGQTIVSDIERKPYDLEELDEVEATVFKIKNDPRITPTWKFLRKRSIDELSQFINVFKENMA